MFSAMRAGPKWTPCCYTFLKAGIQPHRDQNELRGELDKQFSGHGTGGVPWNGRKMDKKQTRMSRAVWGVGTKAALIAMGTRKKRRALRGGLENG